MQPAPLPARGEWLRGSFALGADPVMGKSKAVWWELVLLAEEGLGGWPQGAGWAQYGGLEPALPPSLWHQGGFLACQVARGSHCRLWGRGQSDGPVWERAGGQSGAPTPGSCWTKVWKRLAGLGPHCLWG